MAHLYPTYRKNHYCCIAKINCIGSSACARVDGVGDPETRPQRQLQYRHVHVVMDRMFCFHLQRSSEDHVTYIAGI